MSEVPRNDRPRSAQRSREELGYRSRLERRTAKRTVRRRQVTTKMWRAIIPVAALLAIIVVLLIAFGGGGGDLAQSTATTLAAGPKAGSGLLVIEQEDGVPEVLVMHPAGGSGVVLAIPGITLLKTTSGFKTIAELHASGEAGAMQAALAESFGVAVGPAAGVKWPELREAMLYAGLTAVPAEALSLEGAEAQSVAQSVLEFLAAAATPAGAEAWDSLTVSGDAAGFRAAIAANAEALTGDWSAVATTGSLVEGLGFEYLEPDAEQARALLGGSTREATIKIEVQNGSGVIGAAETAAEMLKALGYTLLPVSNSDDFPDVLTTRITAAPAMAGDAEQVQVALGVGEITEDEDQAVGTILVVLGADFEPPPTDAEATSD